VGVGREALGVHHLDVERPPLSGVPGYMGCGLRVIGSGLNWLWVKGYRFRVIWVVGSGLQVPGCMGCGLRVIWIVG